MAVTIGVAPNKEAALAQEFQRLAARLKAHEPRQTAMADFRLWLAAKGYSLGDVEECIFRLADGDQTIVGAWMKVLKQEEVLPQGPAPQPRPPANPQPAPRPADPFFAAEEEEKPAPIVMASEAHSGLYSGNVVGELAGAPGSVLLTGRTGSGKTTTARALLYGIWLRSCRLGRPARFKVIDLQDEPWLGLESCDMDWIGQPGYSPVVEYLSSTDAGTAEMIRQAARALREASHEVDRRYSLCQDARRKKQPRPVCEDYWLFFNEYLVAYQFWSDLSNKKEVGAQSWQSWLNNVVFRGRSVGVRVLLTVQDHRKESTGISPNMARNMSLGGTGLVDAQGNGGYESLYWLADDKFILSPPSRLELKLAVAQGIKERRPLALTTQGVPRVGELKDYTNLSTSAESEIGGVYPYKGLSKAKEKEVAHV